MFQVLKVSEWVGDHFQVLKVSSRSLRYLGIRWGLGIRWAPGIMLGPRIRLGHHNSIFELTLRNLVRST